MHKVYCSVRDLKNAYELAVKEHREGFVLQGKQFLTAYAKYLLEYLLNVKKMRLNQRIIFTQEGTQ